MDRALLKQALSALESVLDDAANVQNASISGGLYEVVQCRDAIKALQAAIALPVQPADDIHPCSFFCNLPDCIKTQRDLLRDQLCKKATS